jgi:hypothetical protein
MSEPTKSTPIYRAIMVELERKRLAMGMSMDRLSEIVGAERSWSKMLYPDTSSGRQATWEKLQRAVDVLFADGFEVIVRAGETKTGTTAGTKRLIRQAAAHYDRRAARDLMREIGLKGASKGGILRAGKLSGKRRREIAKKAGIAGAKARWSTPRIIEITPPRGAVSEDLENLEQIADQLRQTGGKNANRLRAREH